MAKEKGKNLKNKGKVVRVVGPTVDVYFENAAYFAVSSLGHNPKEQKIKDDIVTLRVDEPFLWILHELKYIDGRYTN